MIILKTSKIELKKGLKRIIIYTYMSQETIDKLKSLIIAQARTIVRYKKLLDDNNISIDDTPNEIVKETDDLESFIQTYLVKKEDGVLLKSDFKNIHSNDDIKKKYKYFEFVKMFEEKFNIKFEKCKTRNQYRDKVIVKGFELKM